MLNVSQNSNDFQSTDFANVAYEADWINSSAPTKDAIQMIIMRSQRPLKLTALMGLITLNFETAINVSPFYLTFNAIQLFYSV